MRIVLYQPEIAQNAGAAIRAAACFSAGVEIIEPCGFPADAAALRRTAMDYRALAPPRLHASWGEFLSSRARAAGRLLLLSTKGAVAIWDFPFAESDLLLIGRESAGVPDDVRAACDASLVIPIAPAARSLNAATAAAIALAEARRQMGWRVEGRHGRS